MPVSVGKQQILKGRKAVDAITYEVELLGKDKIEIGDRDSIDFKPHLKLNRWDGECFIKVGLPTKKKILPTIEGNKIKWIDTDKEVHLYPLEPRTVIAKDKDGKDVEFTQNELGGFEFEVILKKKPKTNKIVLDIETQGLKFYYQPELTPEEIADGAIRPDNVVGSYAVYHATKANHIVGQTNYMCGKAFHIYRPKIVDAVGNWVWGELFIDEQAGTLTTTIPQEFLNNAVYPVSVDPNFGEEEAGGTQASIGGNKLRGSVFASPAGTNTATSITAYTYLGSGTGYIKGVLVLESNLNIVENGVGGAALITPTGWPPQWITSTFATPPSLTASTDYALTKITDVTTTIWYDAGTTDQEVRDGTNSYASPTNPTDASRYNICNSIYCTYEEAAAPIVVTPATISLTLTEYAPSIIIGTVVTPTTSNLVITTYVSVLKEVVTPTTLSLALTTYIPILKEVLTPSKLGLGITTYAPAIVIGTVITPSTLSLTLTTYASVLKEVLTPSTLSLSLTTYAPSIVVGTVITPTTLSLSLTIYVPSIVEGTVVMPTTLSLTLTTYAPSIIEGTVVTPITLSLTLTTYIPTISVSDNIKVTPATLSLALTTYVPILKRVLTPSTLSLILTKYAPVLKEVLTPTTLSLTLTTYAPSIVIGTIVTPTTLSLALTTYAPILKEVLAPTTLSLSLTTYAPILKEIVTSSTLSLTLTTYIPSILGGAAIIPATLSLVLITYAPILKEVLTPTMLSLLLTTYAPSPVIVKGIAALVYFYNRDADVIYHKRDATVYYHERDANVRFR